MIETYPATLPLPSSYGNIIDQGLIRTTTTTPAPNQVKGFNSPRVEIPITFEMSNTDYTQWKAWMEANAWRWFYLPVVSPSDPAEIISNQKVRVISEFYMNKAGHNWLSISMRVEGIQSENFIVTNSS